MIGELLSVLESNVFSARSDSEDAQRSRCFSFTEARGDISLVVEAVSFGFCGISLKHCSV